MSKFNNLKFQNESFPKTSDVLNNSPAYNKKKKADKINLIKGRVIEMCNRFPVYK